MKKVMKHNLKIKAIYLTVMVGGELLVYDSTIWYDAPKKKK